MKLETLESILEDLKKTPHAGLNSHFTCDLKKIGSPGRPYRECTCGLDERIEEVEKEIRKLKHTRKGKRNE
jgi:hypothetical protein